MEKDFYVCTNASREGVGAFLLQEGGVIAYASCKLRNHGVNYATHDLYLTTDVRTFLLQEGGVTSYDSCKLRNHEVNYATHDLYLATDVMALKLWRHHLVGR